MQVVSDSKLESFKVLTSSLGINFGTKKDMAVLTTIGYSKWHHR